MGTNAEKRFSFNWMIEAAEARRDEWLARSEGADLDDDRIADVFAESEEDANTIATGISEGIEFARTMVTESEALMAMMIWEYAQYEAAQSFTHGGDPIYQWLIQDEGAYDGRDNALLVAKAFMRASDWAYANGFDDSEDWEFIPRMMPLIMGLAKTPGNVTSDDCMQCAQVVVRCYIGETEKMNEALTEICEHCGGVTNAPMVNDIPVEQLCKGCDDEEDSL